MRNEDFKINAYFDEKGEELEKLIAYYLITTSSVKRRSDAGGNK